MERGRPWCDWRPTWHHRHDTSTHTQHLLCMAVTSGESQCKNFGPMLEIMYILRVSLTAMDISYIKNIFAKREKLQESSLVASDLSNPNYRQFHENEFLKSAIKDEDRSQSARSCRSTSRASSQGRSRWRRSGQGCGPYGGKAGPLLHWNKMWKKCQSFLRAERRCVRWGGHASVCAWMCERQSAFQFTHHE